MINPSTAGKELCQTPATSRTRSCALQILVFAWSIESPYPGVVSKLKRTSTMHSTKDFKKHIKTKLWHSKRQHTHQSWNRCSPSFFLPNTSCGAKQVLSSTRRLTLIQGPPGTGAVVGSRVLQCFALCLFFLLQTLKTNTKLPFQCQTLKTDVCFKQKTKN